MLKLNPRGWKDIEGYEGLYQIHRQGYVRNARGRIRKPSIINSGYVSLKLINVVGKRKSFLMHRLVASAFVRNDDPRVNVVVNHRDGVKTNNSHRNLEWCTNSHNILHARRIGLNPYNTPGRGKRFGKTSQYHGVGFDEKRNKWYASVTHDKRIHFRRRFDTEVEAALHYNWILRELNLKDRPRNKIR